MYFSYILGMFYGYFRNISQILQIFCGMLDMFVDMLGIFCRLFGDNLAVFCGFVRNTLEIIWEYIIGNRLDIL